MENELWDINERAAAQEEIDRLRARVEDLEAFVAEVENIVEKAYCGGLPIQFNDGDSWVGWSASLLRALTASLDAAKKEVG